MIFKKDSAFYDNEIIAKLHTKIHRKKDFFPGQRKNEEVQLCIRIHWLRRARIFISFFILGILLPGSIFYLLSFLKLQQQIWFTINIIAFIYLLFAWLLVFVEFIKSEFTILVVTNERVADIAQIGLFERQISETNLDRIQEISGFRIGIIGTILDIGRLEIQTAGTDVPFIMQFVKSPHLTARKILDIQKNNQQRKRTSDL